MISLIKKMLKDDIVLFQLSNSIYTTIIFILLPIIILNNNQYTIFISKVIAAESLIAVHTIPFVVSPAKVKEWVSFNPVSNYISILILRILFATVIGIITYRIGVFQKHDLILVLLVNIAQAILPNWEVSLTSYRPLTILQNIGRALTLVCFLFTQMYNWFNIYVFGVSLPLILTGYLYYKKLAKVDYNKEINISIKKLLSFLKELIIEASPGIYKSILSSVLLLWLSNNKNRSDFLLLAAVERLGRPITSLLQPWILRLQGRDNNLTSRVQKRILTFFVLLLIITILYGTISNLMWLSYGGIILLDAIYIYIYYRIVGTSQILGTSLIVFSVIMATITWLPNVSIFNSVWLVFFLALGLAIPIFIQLSNIKRKRVSSIG